jgi:uncharacterized protein (DUF302 family)
LTADGIITERSPRSVADTVSRLTDLIEAKGLKLFTIIDHSAEAGKAGLELPDTKLVIFGSPEAGTPVMVAAPLAALDLPLKVIVWAEADGVVWVSYNSPAYLADRYHLTDDLRARLEPIGSLVAAAVAEA